MAHRMNNALAYVLTNLSLLIEEIEADGDMVPREVRDRYLALSSDAVLGAGRLSELIRELQVLGWGDEALDGEDTGSSEDTWDNEGGTAHILIIDDEAPILNSLKLALRRYKVGTLLDASLATEYVEANGKPDLILCDLIMPTMGGIELYRALQKNQRDLVPRVMFMTGGAFTPELRTFLSSIRNPVMHKPFDTKTLRWMVAQQLRRASSAQA
jgi:CheY-like chemotaxis protein